MDRLILTSVEFPCKDCRERKVGCHARCSKYLELKKKSKELHRARLRALIVISNPAKDRRHNRYIREHRGTR